MSLLCFDVVSRKNTTYGGHRLSPALKFGLLESSDIGQTQVCNVFRALEQVSDRFDGDVIAWTKVRVGRSMEATIVHRLFVGLQYDRCSRSRLAAASSPRSTNADMAASVS